MSPASEKPVRCIEAHQRRMRFCHATQELDQLGGKLYIRTAIIVGSSTSGKTYTKSQLLPCIRALHANSMRVWHYLCCKQGHLVLQLSRTRVLPDDRVSIYWIHS